MSNRFKKSAIVAAIGAGLGSTSMMLVLSAHDPAEADQMSDQDRIVAAVRRDEPSVVALDVDINGQRFVPADPFAQAFGGPADNGRMSPFHERASGSGFVYSKDGLIVTNAHVVRFDAGSKAKITVVFPNGDRVPAHVYAADPAADVALIKVDNYAKLPPPLELGHSSDVEAGQWAIAIGEPFALQHSVAVGVVSGFDRTETIGSDDDPNAARTFKGLLQTSAPINPGNSGGPLIDDAGRVIGVNQSVASPQAGAQGIGFAIPADTVRQQVALLERHPGELDGPPVPYLGIRMTPLSASLREQLAYRGRGVPVEGVYQGGPADKAGVQPGDIILQIDGKDVTTDAQVVDAVRAMKPGEKLRLEIWRGGFKQRAVIAIGTAPPDFQVGEAQQPEP
jgi:S1-C subfamily serine protease